MAEGMRLSQTAPGLAHDQTQLYVALLLEISDAATVSFEALHYL